MTCYFRNMSNMVAYILFQETSDLHNPSITSTEPQINILHFPVVNIKNANKSDIITLTHQRSASLCMCRSLSVTKIQSFVTKIRRVSAARHVPFCVHLGNTWTHVGAAALSFVTHARRRLFSFQLSANLLPLHYTSPNISHIWISYFLEI